MNMGKVKKPAKELPPRGSFGLFISLVMIALSLLAVYMIRVAAVVNGISDGLDKITDTRRFIDRDIPLYADYTGNAAIDKGIATLIGAFMAGPTGWDEGFQVQMFYFLVSFFTIISLWSIESVRKRNALGLTSL